MDSKDFSQQAKQDPQILSFLQESAEEAKMQMPPEKAQRYVTITGVDILIAIGAYVLYRWIKDYFDHRRALKETEVARQQEEIVAALIKDGFPPSEARAVTIALLNRISKRNADDPVIKAAIGLIGKS